MHYMHKMSNIEKSTVININNNKYIYVALETH